MEKNALSAGEYDALASLRVQGEPYELTPSDICQSNMLSSGGLTKVLNNLEKRELISRHACNEDQRSRKVRLTNAGKKLIESALAEAFSEYTSLPRQEAFDIEYWLLEEAKLQRMPAEKPLSRKVAIVTGAAGGIGKAIADKLVAEGANVILTDISQENLDEALATYKRDEAAIAICDVTKEESIEKAYKEANLAFGGVDIVVHSAGLAISKSLPDTTLSDWELLQNVLVKGQFLMAQKGVEIMRKQGLGGDIVNIASKNGLVSGPNNVGYGTAKAAQQHMTRLLAAELGGDHIRVNTVNPDGVIVGSKIWEGDWAEGRAKAHGIKVEDLPAHYAKRNLLNEIILPEDIANGVFACVGILEKSTGNTINVDGGMANAFVR